MPCLSERKSAFIFSKIRRFFLLSLREISPTQPSPEGRAIYYVYYFLTINKKVSPTGGGLEGAYIWDYNVV